ncbi:MAG: ribosome biogenesis GTPase Der [Alphaproteobacteria bacterium]
MNPLIAIIGRPNVGKSTLFNRLVGKRLALVDDRPGVTRDRRYASARLGDLAFTILDTAGLEEAPDASLAGRMREQTSEAIREADVILMVVDVRAGVTPLDRHFAQMLRASGKKVILVGNKAEGHAGRAGLSDLYSLGFESIALISAEHGEGMGELYEALTGVMGDTWRVTRGEGDDAVPKNKSKRKLKKSKSEPLEEDASPTTHHAPLSIAIIGRPNAGKSTLINALICEELILTGDEPGITRDAIAIDFEHHGRAMKLVDTAGMRKRANIEDKVEKLAVADTVRALQYAQVVVVLIDATIPMEKQDAVIAALVEREGRASVIGLNNWDLVRGNKKEYLEELRYLLDKQLPQLSGVTVAPCSGLKREGLNGLLDACIAAYDIWNRRVPTAELNRWLEDIVAHHSPPMVKGRRLKVKYMTQVKTRPPAFQLHCNMAKEFPDAYLRYLINGLRESFGLIGTPIRFHLKASENPFAKKKKKRS